MNASRRISCNAANAFRPSLALRNVFSDLIGLQCASGRKDGQRRRIANDPRVPGVVYRNGHKPRKGSLIGRLDMSSQSIADALDDGVENAEDHRKNDDQKIENTSAGHASAVDEEADSHLAIDEILEDVYVHRYADKGPKDEAEKIGTYSSPKLEQIAEKKLRGAQQEVFEYEGQYVNPVSTTRVRDFELPWMKGLNLTDTSIDATKRLGSEVQAFARWVRPTEAEIAAREAVIEQTMKIIRGSTSDFEVEPFGSSRNGLGLSNSDIDLRLYQDEGAKDVPTWSPKPAPPRWKVRKSNIKALFKLQRVFQNHRDYILGNIRHARYPLLHMQHKLSGIDIQVVLANDTSEQRAWVRSVILRHPGIADIFAVYKTLLDLRGLTDVFRGGIGTYGIFVLILAGLRMDQTSSHFSAERRSRGLDTDIDAQTKLGRDIMQVSWLWNIVDTYRFAVDVQNGRFLRKLSPDLASSSETQRYKQLRIIDQSEPYLLCLPDPCDDTNDLGRKAYGWKHIQATTKELFNGVYARRKHGLKPGRRSFLAKLVGSAPFEYDLRRAKAEAYGRAVLTGQDMKTYRLPKYLHSPRVARSIDLDPTESSRSPVGGSESMTPLAVDGQDAVPASDRGLRDGNMGDALEATFARDNEIEDTSVNSKLVASATA